MAASFFYCIVKRKTAHLKLVYKPSQLINRQVQSLIHTTTSLFLHSKYYFFYSDGKGREQDDITMRGSLPIKQSWPLCCADQKQRQAWLSLSSILAGQVVGDTPIAVPALTHLVGWRSQQACMQTMRTVQVTDAQTHDKHTLSIILSSALNFADLFWL